MIWMPPQQLVKYRLTPEQGADIRGKAIAAIDELTPFDKRCLTIASKLRYAILEHEEI